MQANLITFSIFCEPHHVLDFLAPAASVIFFPAFLSIHASRDTFVVQKVHEVIECVRVYVCVCICLEYMVFGSSWHLKII